MLPFVSTYYHHKFQFHTTCTFYQFTFYFNKFWTISSLLIVLALFRHPTFINRFCSFGFKAFRISSGIEHPGQFTHDDLIECVRTKDLNIYILRLQNYRCAVEISMKFRSFIITFNHVSILTFSFSSCGKETSLQTLSFPIVSNLLDNNNFRKKGQQYNRHKIYEWSTRSPRSPEANTVP